MKVWCVSCLSNNVLSNGYKIKHQFLMKYVFYKNWLITLLE